MTKKNKCSKCGKGVMKLTRFKISELPYQEHTCNKCGYVQKSEDYIAKSVLGRMLRMLGYKTHYNSDVKKLYTKRAWIYDRMAETVGRHRSFEEFFLQGDYLKSGSRVLDAGCGSGAITQSLIEVASKKNIGNVEFYGFDLTPAMLEVFDKWIRGHDYKNIQLREANVLELNQKLPVDWSNFDLVVSANMLEHIPREMLPQALRNLKSLLKNNGKLIVFIESDNFINRTFIKWLWGSEVYTEDQLVHVFQEAGFKLPRIDKFGSRFFSCFSVVAESENNTATNNR